MDHQDDGPLERSCQYTRFRRLSSLKRGASRLTEAMPDTWQNSSALAGEPKKKNGKSKPSKRSFARTMAENQVEEPCQIAGKKIPTMQKAKSKALDKSAPEWMISHHTFEHLQEQRTRRLVQNYSQTTQTTMPPQVAAGSAPTVLPFSVEVSSKPRDNHERQQKKLLVIAVWKRSPRQMLVGRRSMCVMLTGSWRTKLGTPARV